MGLEYNTFRHGATTFPVTASQTNSFLRDADPTVYWLLDYFAFVIDKYVGERLLLEAGDCGAPIENAVEYSVPDNPEAYLTQEQVKFPLLSLHRTNDVVTDRTMTWRGSKCTLKLHYVLPTLDAAQRERVMPVLHAVARIIDSRIENTYDPTYLSGALILGEDYANLEKINLMAVDYGEWSSGGDLTFPSVSMTIEAYERDEQVPGAFDAMTSVLLNEDLAETGETTLPDVVEVDTDTSP